MEKPPSYVYNESKLVYFHMKSLYGIKQTPPSWCAEVNNLIFDIRFSRFYSDLNVYLIIIFLYVDDLIFIDSDCKILTHVKKILKNKF